MYLNVSLPHRHQALRERNTVFVPVLAAKKIKKNTDKTLQTTVLALITIQKFSSNMANRIEVFP